MKIPLPTPEQRAMMAREAARARPEPPKPSSPMRDAIIEMLVVLGQVRCAAADGHPLVPMLREIAEEVYSHYASEKPGSQSGRAMARDMVLLCEARVMRV